MRERTLAARPVLADDKDVRIDVGLVAVGGEEPRLDCPLASHALNPAAALREPDVAEPSTEETALSLVLGDDAERTEALVDDVGSPSSA